MSLTSFFDLLDNVDSFIAGRDDLTECLFIDDCTHLWRNYPKWSVDRYFNSGVFSVPAGYREFFGRIRKESLDDNDY